MLFAKVTLMMQRDENGQIIKESVIKFDLRGELGVAVELCKQAVPVIANECMVRVFYFIRHLTMMLSRLVDTFFSRTSWTMLLYAENHSISVA